MEMNPTEQSKSSEKVNSLPEGYIDMTVGSSSSTSSKGRSKVKVISVESSSSTSFKDRSKVKCLICKK